MQDDEEVDGGVIFIIPTVVVFDADGEEGVDDDVDDKEVVE